MASTPLMAAERIFHFNFYSTKKNYQSKAVTYSKHLKKGILLSLKLIMSHLTNASP